jgi:hypothetical protein
MLLVGLLCLPAAPSAGSRKVDRLLFLRFSGPATGPHGGAEVEQQGNLGACRSGAPGGANGI